MKSRTDNDEPRLVMPYTAKLDPKRAKLRRDNDDPKLTKSSTDNDDPRRAMP